MPLPGAGLSGGCLPREAAGGTAPVAGQLWKPGFSSGRNSVCRAWRLRGGAADLLSWGRSVLAVLGPPGLCLSRGRPDPGLCPGALCSGACAGGFALPGRAAPSAEPPPEPLRAAPGTAQPPPHGASSSARAPPSCSRGRAAPSAEPPPEPLQLLRVPSPLRGAAPEPPELLRVPPCALQPLGSSAHSPGRAVALLLSPGARGHPRPPGSCSNSPRAPFRPGRSVQLLLLRDGALLSWGHSPRPQPGSSRGPSPLEAFVSLLLFPRLPTLIEARTLLTVAFQLVSL